MTAWPRALIFDVDGTLAETEDTHRMAFNEVFAAEGLDWHWDQAVYRQLLKVTGGKERMRHWIDAFGARPVLDDTAIAALHRTKTARYTAMIDTRTVPLRPGIARLIDEAAAAGIALAIATTTSLANVESLLRATLGDDAVSRFAAIAAGDMVTAKKPAPDVYSLALRQLGLPASACVAFEDSRNGLRSAHGAGLRCIITPSVYTDDEDFAGAALVVDHLGDVDRPVRLPAPLSGHTQVDLAALRELSA
ncbi:MAG: HAD-IA family hydrolase [Geminicoccaceae bacterium]